MAAPRNIKIDITKGASKELAFVLEDSPNLTAAVITLTVKLQPEDPDTEIALSKTYDPALSPKLAEGKFSITLNPVDTEQLVPRTYVYELRVQLGEKVYIPLVGDFVVYKNVRRV